MGRSILLGLMASRVVCCFSMSDFGVSLPSRELAAILLGLGILSGGYVGDGDLVLSTSDRAGEATNFNVRNIIESELSLGGPRHAVR